MWKGRIFELGDAQIALEQTEIIWSTHNSLIKFTITRKPTNKDTLTWGKVSALHNSQDCIQLWMKKAAHDPANSKKIINW